MNFYQVNSESGWIRYSFFLPNFKATLYLFKDKSNF